MRAGIIIEMDPWKNRPFITFCLSLLLLLSTAISALELKESEYQAIKQVSLEVASDPNSIVIGIGRSPTSVIAFLQKYRPRLAFNLPLSAFRYLPAHLEGDDREIVKNFDKPLNAVQRRRLFDHFDRFFPPEKLIGKKKIVLLDYSERGNSLFAAKSYLEEYLRLRRRTHEISLVALVEKANVNNVTRRAETIGNTVKTIVLREGPFLNALQFQHYDVYAEFDAYNLGINKSRDLKHRATYDELGAAIANRMEKDRPLKARRCRNFLLTAGR